MLKKIISIDFLSKIVEILAVTSFGLAVIATLLVVVGSLFVS